MAYYNTCPNCGSNLDPGEICDCGKERAHEGDRERDIYTGGGDMIGDYIKARSGAVSLSGNRAARVG